jgi:hypothetical protein
MQEDCGKSGSLLDLQSGMDRCPDGQSVQNYIVRSRTLIISRIVQLTAENPGNAMKKEKAGPEKRVPAGREKGLNQTERSLLQKSTERHDKALRILSKL